MVEGLISLNMFEQGHKENCVKGNTAAAWKISERLESFMQLNEECR